MGIGIKITCGPNYPDFPPTAIFTHPIKLTFTNNSGVVNNSLPIMKNWKRGNTLCDLVSGIDLKVTLVLLSS